MTVERDGYVTAPSSETRTITVQAGQTTADVNLELVRTGAISGRIVDSDGEPLPTPVCNFIPSARKGAAGVGSTTADHSPKRTSSHQNYPRNFCPFASLALRGSGLGNHAPRNPMKNAAIEGGGSSVHQVAAALDIAFSIALSSRLRSMIDSLISVCNQNRPGLGSAAARAEGEASGR